MSFFARLFGNPPPDEWPPEWEHMRGTEPIEGEYFFRCAEGRLFGGHRVTLPPQSLGYVWTGKAVTRFPETVSKALPDGSIETYPAGPFDIRQKVIRVAGHGEIAAPVTLSRPMQAGQWIETARIVIRYSECRWLAPKSTATKTDD